MKKEALIFGLIPESQYPSIEVSDKIIRNILDQYNLLHDHLEIFEDTNIAAPMWVTPTVQGNRIISYNKIGYNSYYKISKSMILHEYGHTIYNMKILNNIYNGKVTCDRSTFLMNAEYYADTFCLDTLFKNKEYSTLSLHLMHMLFYGYYSKNIDKCGYNGEHKVAATRIFRKKNFKKYKKYIDPLHILQRHYYVPTIML